MRFAQLTDTEGLSRLAVLRDQRALVLCELDPALPRTLQALIDTDALDAVRAAVASAAGEVVASAFGFRQGHCAHAAEDHGDWRELP